jgi:hypothetical protein
MRKFWIYILPVLYGAPAVNLIWPFIPPDHRSPFLDLLDAWFLFLAHPSLATGLWSVVYSLWWIPVCYISGHLVAVLFYPLHWVLSQPEYQIKENPEGANPTQD